MLNARLNKLIEKIILIKAVVVYRVLLYFLLQNIVALSSTHGILQANNVHQAENVRIITLGYIIL